MDDFTMIIFIIIILFLIAYPLYKFYKKQRESFNVNDIKRAIDKVGKLGRDISGLGKQIRSEVSKVGNLGKDIKKMGPQIKRIAKYPVELGEKLEIEMKKVASEAEKGILDEFNKAKGDVEKIANEVEDFAKKSVSEVEGELNKIIKTIEKIPSEVVYWANKIFMDFIPKLFREGWKQFKKHVIDPIMEFFKHVGDVFDKIGDVFKEIINFIINLPQCIPIYAFDTSKDIFIATMKTMLPGWLKNMIRGFNRYIVQPILIPIFNFFTNIFVND